MSTVPLADWLSLLESGSRPKGGVKSDGGEVPSLGAEHLSDDGGFDFAKLKLVPRSFFDEMKKGKLQCHDILIVKDGATTGKVSFVGNAFPFGEAGINEHLFRLRVDERKANPSFVFRFLQSPRGQAQIQKDFRGATVGGIGRTFVDKVLLPDLDIAQQCRIATILDKADAIRHKREQALALADDFLHSAFLEMFGDPVTNPKRWPLKMLGEICVKITDGTHKTPKYTEEGVIFLSAKNLTLNGIDWENTKFISRKEHLELIKRCDPEYLDILMSKSGSLGTAVIVDRKVDFSLFESAALIKYDHHALSPYYLQRLLMTKGTQSQLLRSTKGVAVKHLHLVDIRSLQVPVPPIEVQQTFAGLVEKNIAIKDTLTEEIREQGRLFASLSQRAFNGGL